LKAFRQDLKRNVRRRGGEREGGGEFSAADPYKEMRNVASIVGFAVQTPLVRPCLPPFLSASTCSTSLPLLFWPTK